MSAVIQNTAETSITKGSILGAVLLISGTCIGGGMLAMPVHLAEAGFAISAMGLIISWFFMTYTGLLLVEATLWIRNGAHFASLSRILIGNWAKIVALTVYLFMNYASLIAYTAGGVGLLNIWVKSLLGFTLEYNTGCAIFTIIFGLVVYLGAQFVGKFNALLMAALVLAYVGLVASGLGLIKTEHLAFRPSWHHSFGIFSMILATFSYQMVVPSVCSYLNYDERGLKKAIIFGTAIPFITYLVWLTVIHGAIPLDGENGLRDAFTKGLAATAPLRVRLDHWSLTAFSDIFTFMALVTSYLGLSLALFDFLEDSFKEIKITLSRNMTCLLTFLPVAILASLYPRALLQFLDISGGYGDTILSGTIPVLMVWYGRYKKKYTANFVVPGGKLGLVAALTFFLTILIVQHF